MLSDHPLIGFIPTTDAERSKAFYVDVLKLKFVADDHFALVVATNSSTIRIVRMQEFTPAQGTILGWEVPDLPMEVASLTEAGITFERYGFLEHDALGIWTTPSGSKVAWFKDPDGNVLSLSQH
ncbi:VOC family protein [Granulicella sibirica]|uniref:Glyoxalase/bleomycin resistance protein/dioxygenase n=1 Tax=Granulicella sibirica TaxID=2479048 RepID=A0A4Q0T7L1_9BACT|nr:VOC family protein [Granulicella sibirica]RXH57676.1 Glyoxalase/bleomycin resistance protein/dioxygenase [Granulicella sibirica]